MSAETTPARPRTISYSSILYVAVGAFLAVAPFISIGSAGGIAASSFSVPLYTIGGLAVVASLGMMKLKRWGLWLSLLLFPVLMATPASALNFILQTGSLTASADLTLFTASLIAILVLLAPCLAFLLDKRNEFS